MLVLVLRWRMEPSLLTGVPSLHQAQQMTHNEARRWVSRHSRAMARRALIGKTTALDQVLHEISSSALPPQRPFPLTLESLQRYILSMIVYTIVQIANGRPHLIPLPADSPRAERLDCDSPQP